MIFLL